MVTTIFTICSLRTNVVFFSALFTLIFAFGSAAGAFWNLALGNADLGGKLTIVSLHLTLSHLHFSPIRSLITLSAKLGSRGIHLGFDNDGMVSPSRSVAGMRRLPCDTASG